MIQMISFILEVLHEILEVIHSVNFCMMIMCAKETKHFWGHWKAISPCNIKVRHIVFLNVMVALYHCDNRMLMYSSKPSDNTQIMSV